MKQFDVLTIGGATLDLMMYTDECEIIKNPHDMMRRKLIGFEYGAKINTDEVMLTYGGGAANTAYNFAKQGLKTAMRVQVANDATGEDVIAYFKKHKVDTTLITTQKDGHTGFSVIINTGTKNEHVAFLYRGANHVMKLRKKDFVGIHPTWLYVTSFTGQHCTYNLDMIHQVVKQKGLNWAWNPGNEQLELGYKKLSKYLHEVTVFNVNKDEAIELVSGSGTKTDNITTLLKTIYSWGPSIVVITCGPKGAYVFDGEKQYHTKALPVKGINTTGAGDAFGSTFVTGLIKTKGNIQHALAAAIVNSNFVIQKIGAQAGLLSWYDIQKQIKKYKLKVS